MELLNHLLDLFVTGASTSLYLLGLAYVGLLPVTIVLYRNVADDDEE